MSYNEIHGIVLSHEGEKKDLPRDHAFESDAYKQWYYENGRVAFRVEVDSEIAEFVRKTTEDHEDGSIMNEDDTVAVTYEQLCLHHISKI